MHFASSCCLVLIAPQHSSVGVAYWANCVCVFGIVKSDPAESGPPASIGEFFTRQSVNKPSIGTKTDDSDDKETEEEQTPETKGSSEHRSCNLTVEKCRQTFALLKPKELVAVGEIFPPQLDSGEGIPTSQMSAGNYTDGDVDKL